MGSKGDPHFPWKTNPPPAKAKTPNEPAEQGSQHGEPKPTAAEAEAGDQEARGEGAKRLQQNITDKEKQRVHAGFEMVGEPVS
jgi:hypothetical protein